MVRRRSPLRAALAALPLSLGALGCASEAVLEEESSTASAESAPSHVVRGTLRGLRGSGLVLENNGGDDIAVGVDGTFVFTELVVDGTAYDVSVSLEPTAPLERCTVTNGKGIVSGADVTDVVVDCELAELAVGGRVSGLDAVGLVLSNASAAGEESIALAKDGAFLFVHDVEIGTRFDVRIVQQPDGVVCTVERGEGTMAAGVLPVDVACAPAAPSS